MTATNTSRERVDVLIHLSDQIYPVLERRNRSERRARQIVRLGFGAVAVALREGQSVERAGEQFDDLLTYELRHLDFGKFVERGDYARQLTKPDRIYVPHDLGELADRYSDVERATMLSDLSPEPDSVHALHLAALAVPYAGVHYPDLSRGKIALYGLVHDLPEAYVGDTPTFNISARDLNDKRIKEESAMHQFHAEYGDRWPELVEVVESYEALADDEAKFLKTFDKLDPGFTHLHNGAMSLRINHGVTKATQFKRIVANGEKRMLPYATDFPEILADRREMMRRISLRFEP